MTWLNNTVSDLGRCGPFPYFSRGHGINDAGVIVGYEGRQLGGPSEAFHTVNGVLTRIGRPAGSAWSVANGISAGGTMAVVQGDPTATARSHGQTACSPTSGRGRVRLADGD